MANTSNINSSIYKRNIDQKESKDGYIYILSLIKLHVSHLYHGYSHHLSLTIHAIFHGSVLLLGTTNSFYI